MANPIHPDDRSTVKPADVAEALGIGKTTALGLMSSGQIPSNHIGRYWLTTPRILREFMERTRSGSSSPLGCN